MERIVLISVIFLGACTNNAQLHTVIDDIKATPKCDTTNVYVSPRDTKKSLTGKVIILNSKLDCHDDNDYYTDEKLNKYEDL